MATLAPPSPAKQTTTAGEHREGELLVLFGLLTANSALVMYILWGDMEFVESAGVTYLALALLLGRIFRCWEPRTDGGRWCLDAAIWLLFLLLAVLQVPRLARAAAYALAVLQSSTSATMLVAAAGATAALGVGGCFAYLLHRRSWSKQQRQEVIFSQLRQDPRN